MSDADAEWEAAVLISACLPPSLRASCRVQSASTVAAGSMPPSGIYGEVDWLPASAAANCHRSSSPGPSQSPRVTLSLSSVRPASAASMPDPSCRVISLDSTAMVSIPASHSRSVLASCYNVSPKTLPRCVTYDIICCLTRCETTYAFAYTALSPIIRHIF